MKKYGLGWDGWSCPHSVTAGPEMAVGKCMAKAINQVLPVVLGCQEVTKWGSPLDEVVLPSMVCVRAPAEAVR